MVNWGVYCNFSKAVLCYLIQIIIFVIGVFFNQILNNGVITIDKAKPIFKIAVTLQHFFVLLGDFDCLVQANLMKEEYRDTLVVSLFDLMIMSDFIQSEDEWIEYLNIHNEIYAKNFKFMDELEVLNGFLKFRLNELLF